MVRTRITRATAALACALFLACPLVSRADTFRRGDTDGSGTVDISDAIALVSFLFLGSSEPSCLDAADSDDNGELEITDAIVTLGYLFSGGAEPPAPGPSKCGADPSSDGLGTCVSPLCGPSMSFNAMIVRLPEDQTTQVAADLAGQMVDDAVTTVLNSEGDTVHLHLAGSASVSIFPGVPVIASLGYDPQLVLNEDGSVDLALSLEVGAGIGLELTEGVEANVLEVMESMYVFRFPDLEGALAALRSIVASQLLLPVADTSLAVIAGFEALTEALVQAVDELDAASLLEEGIRRTISDTQATIRSIETSLANLTGPIDDFLDNIARLENLVATLCGKLFEPDACDTWRSELSKARRALASVLAEKSRLQSALASARNTLSGAQAALQPAVDAVREAQQKVHDLEAEVEETRRDAETARDVIEFIAQTRTNLEFHLSALQLKKAAAAKIEAFLSPFPGVKVEGAGVGAQATEEMGAEIRLEFAADGAVSGLSLTLFKEAAIQASAALAVGVEGGASLELAAILEFTRGTDTFVEAQGTMKLALDAYAVATAGVVLEFQYGAGRRMEMLMDLAQLGGVASGLWELVDSGDADSLADALAGFEATFTAQDRWIAAAVAGAGVSYLGTGGSMEGSATWADQGPGNVEVVSVSEALRELYTAAASSAAIELLGDVVTETAP